LVLAAISLLFSNTCVDFPVYQEVYSLEIDQKSFQICSMGIKREHCFFLDIETAPLHFDLYELDEIEKKLWYNKIKYRLYAEQNVEELYRKKSGVMAEFARIVCIAFGYYENNDLVTGVLAHEEEAELIKRFFDVISDRTNKDLCFAGHNIREFDIPFICRRALINGIKLPSALQLHNKKPWEIRLLDTFQHWRFGDVKQYTSLELLCFVMKIPSSKKNMDGSLVAPMYWEKDPIQNALNLMWIKQYCQSDVIAVAALIDKMNLLDPEG
jgi:DNA polymerase elongation subunit (family B)